MTLACIMEEGSLEPAALLPLECKAPVGREETFAYRLNAPIAERALDVTETSVVSLLGRVASGDPSAVQDCIDTYGPLVWAIARRLSPTANEAEDAVQEIFIQLWQSAGRFDPAIASEKGFVAMIARRRLIDRMRKSERRPQLESFEERYDEPVSRHHEKIERDLEAAAALQALNTLQPKQRRVLMLSVYQGMSHGEIAAATDLPLGTVKSHIARGLAQIRQNLKSSRSRSAGA